jgi:two-component sensor histidine kinase
MIALFDDERLLLLEFNHRLSNTLQIIASQVARCRQATVCDVVKPMLEDLDSRLRALGAMHHLLAASGMAGFPEDYCTQLCACLVRAFGREDVAVRVRVEDLPLSEDRAAKVALIVVELVTNVFKHSLRVEQGGIIWVDLRATAAGAEIVVSDSLTATFENGLPSRIVGHLAKALSGEAFVADRAGFIAGVRFPLECGR